MILCDTNILIDLYRGNQKIVSSLKQIGEENIAISDITTAEIFFAARDRKDLIFLEKQLQQIAKLAVNESISKLAVEFIIKYSLSHRLSLADAFIASTAIHYDFPLFTLNVKDFRYIDGLQLYPSL